jgi:aryl-alcohol dehydrogenase-like predicted oxidoreductase
MLYTDLTADSDHAVIDAVGAIADAHGVSRARIALAWLRHNPVVAAPVVGASKASQIDDAVASVTIHLTDEELLQLQRPYTPRHDFQGISDDAELERIKSQLPGFNPET